MLSQLQQQRLFIGGPVIHFNVSVTDLTITVVEQSLINPPDGDFSPPWPFTCSVTHLRASASSANHIT